MARYRSGHNGAVLKTVGGDEPSVGSNPTRAAMPFHMLTLDCQVDESETNYAANQIIQYCIDNKIGNIVLGYNEGFQDRTNLGRVNNQNFVQIPIGKLKCRLKYLSDLNGINFMLQEESYTSKASFFDKDDIPVWNPQNPAIAEFSGTRIHRGLYKTKSGTFVNADINGALNILRKSNVVSLETLYSRGEVNTPLRIRVL